ncbi:MAG: SemiSWEET transporter, partial [bacterium]
LGAIAGTLTTISFLPQVIKAYKSKQTKDLSLLMLVLFCLGVFFWFLDGIVLKQPPMLIANGTTLLLGFFLIYLKLKYSGVK